MDNDTVVRTIYFVDETIPEYVIDCQALNTYLPSSIENPRSVEIRLSLAEAQQLQIALAKFIARRKR